MSRAVSDIRRKDGVEMPLEARHLLPIIKTARDVRGFATSQIGTIDADLVVYIPEDRRNLSKLSRAYVEAGEREGWHQAPSFEALRDNGANWYTLRREADPAPILLVKTMQYSPLVLWNDAAFLANQ